MKEIIRTHMDVKALVKVRMLSTVLHPDKSGHFENL